MQSQERTKICYIVTKGNWGGAQKYVYNLATNLPRNLYDPVVITGEGNILEEKLNKKSIRCYVVASLKRDISFISEIKSSLALLKIVRREKPDVLHLNSPKASGFGAVAGRLCGTKKIIQTVHGWSFNEDRSNLIKSLIWFFSWLTIMLCHKTIVIAEKEKWQAMRMPFVKNKIILIHNGIEKINFIEKDEATKKLFSMTGRDRKENVMILGTISELHKNKGLEYIISALAKIKTDFIFFVIGEGEERKNLENLIEKHGLKDKVFLLGFLENANQYLKAFDIFTLTSIKEGLPYSILEAGQAGLPVIANNVGGISDIIYNGKDGVLISKGNLPNLILAIQTLIERQDKRAMLGKNLEEKVLNEYSLQKMIDKTAMVYVSK